MKAMRDEDKVSGGEKVAGWVGRFVLIAGGISLAGVVVGAVAFPLVGWVVGMERETRELAVTGMKTLGFFFTVWSPGIALVWTVKQAYEAKARKARARVGADGA